jgi:hypothetical protein
VSSEVFEFGKGFDVVLVRLPVLESMRVSQLFACNLFQTIGGHDPTAVAVVVRTLGIQLIAGKGANEVASSACSLPTGSLGTLFPPIGHFLACLESFLSLDSFGFDANGQGSLLFFVDEGSKSI